MSKQPNILLITSDQQRGDCYSFAGRKVKTPHLERLKNGGTWFKTCTTPNPICMPARSSILTGQLPLTHGVCDNGIDLDAQLGENGFGGTLTKAGYDSAFLGKAHFSSKRAIKPTGRPESKLSSADYPNDWNGPYMGFEHVELKMSGNFHRHSVRKPVLPPMGQHFERWIVSRGIGDKVYDLWADEFDDGNPTPKTWHSLLPPAWHTTAWTADRSIDWLKNRNRDKPFVMWTSFDDPHYDFDCPVPWSLLHDVDDVDISQTHERDFDQRPWWHEASLTSKPQAVDPKEAEWRTKGSRMDSLTERQLRKVTANYYGMISFIDHHVGRIISTLQDLGDIESTLIVYTSDHGELLGDHGLYQKGPTPYEGLLNVGAIFSGPGVPKNTVIDDTVTTLDLSATFCDYAGTSLPHEAQSQSLRPLLEGKPGPTRDATYSEWYLKPYRVGIELDLRIVRTPRYKLAFDTITEAGELYDLVDDPLENENRFDDPGIAKTRKELEGLLKDRPGPILSKEELPEHTAPGGS
jgi:arylsulfatase A-like enzyme